MQESFYPPVIMQYLENLPNGGTMPVDNAEVFCAELGTIAKKIVIKLYMAVTDGIINKITYLVFGNGYVIAALGRVSEDLPGMKVKQALNYSISNLGKELEIPVPEQNKLKLIKQGIDQVVQQYLDSTKT